MKLKALFLFVLLIPALWAQPVVKEARDLSPPIDWKKTTLADEAWWPALMAEFQPEKLTFEQWKEFYSDAFIQKNQITEEIFKQHARSVAENRDAVHPVSELTRLLFIRDGDDQFLRVEEVVARSTDPRGSDTKRVTFLKKKGDGWIIWNVPADMPFGSPLQNVR